jgi:predicted porin
MKTRLVICLAFVLYATESTAQNSVTLYGVVDAGLTYINNHNGSPQIATQDGYLQAGRFGFLGSEDLGGGVNAIFRLENGFNPFTGQIRAGGGLFGRSAWVGITGPNWGSITLGRQYDSVSDFYQPTIFSNTWGPLFSHAGDIDNAISTYRQSNGVKYVSANYGGVRGGALYAFGGVPGAFGQLSTVTAGASFSRGPLYIGLAYAHSSKPVQQYPDGAWTFGGPFSYLGNSATNSPEAKEMFGVGGTYRIGKATVGIDYSHTKFSEINGTTGSALFENYEIWWNYQFRPDILVGVGDTFTTSAVPYNNLHPKYNQINAAADYIFSKRTDVYLEISYQAAFDGATADIYGPFTGPSSTNRQLATHVGLRTRF